MLQIVPNEALTEAHLPPANAEWRALGPFALTFDGYGAFDRPERCGEFANRVEAHHMRTGSLPFLLSLTELRACLFFEQRRWRHMGYDPEGDALAYLHALLEAIRHEVRRR